MKLLEAGTPKPAESDTATPEVIASQQQPAEKSISSKRWNNDGFMYEILDKAQRKTKKLRIA